MKTKAITKLIEEYDEYLSSLRHISCLGMNDKKIQESGSNADVKSVERYLTPKINDAHQQLINQFINNMIGKEIDFNDVRDIKNFICYPDFCVKSYIENPANLYKNRISIEKSVFIAPTYELNLKIDANSKVISPVASIVRIKRLELGPTINIFSLVEDEVDNYLLEEGIRNIIQRFKKEFGSEPNKNDLILLRNIAIKYILERIRNKEENSITCLYDNTAYLSYDFQASKKNICSRYNIYFSDKYISVSSVGTPWIFRGLEYFDNRIVVNKDGDDTIVPLICQRIKK